MEFIDLAFQQQRIREKLEGNMSAVLNHGKFIMGPEVQKLEETLADYVGVKHAVGCASGTDALLMALMAYNVGSGDAVLTTPFTFVATAEVISLLGATPVFVDIDADTFNIDPQKLEEALRRTPVRPKAIIAVDLFGLPSDYEAITDIAEKYNLILIEDAAQSFGAMYHGRRSCSFGNISCTSFFPAKPLGCYGDGGMCFTNEDDIVAILRSIRVHGQGGHKYDNVRIGINGRLDTLQAAILLAKYEIFEEEIELRQNVAGYYTTLLSSLPGVKTPQIPDGYMSAWAQYSVMAGDGIHRDAIQAGLNRAGIPTAIYYPKPLHLQQAFAPLGYKKGDFPVSEECASRIFSLPMHPYLKREDQERIANIFRTMVAI